MKNAEKGCRLTVPYPAPRRPERLPVPQTVHRLRRAAAGPGGVMTVLHRSLRRAAVCRENGEDGLAALLEAEAQTALDHLELLARMLVCCGAENPFFVPQGGHKIWWSGVWTGTCRKEELSAEVLLRETLADCAAWQSLADALPLSLRPCAERILADRLHHAGLLRQRLIGG